MRLMLTPCSLSEIEPLAARNHILKGLFVMADLRSQSIGASVGREKKIAGTNVRTHDSRATNKAQLSWKPFSHPHMSPVG